MKLSGAGLMWGLGLAGLLSLGAEEATNPDGTKRSSQSLQDLSKTREKKEVSNPQQRDPRLEAKANEAKFPEEERKKRLQELERARLSAEEKERQRRMLDKTTKKDRTVNANLKQRNSFPNRY